MKNRISFSIAAALLLVVGLFAAATPAFGAGRRHHDGPRHFERLSRYLDLTDAQRTQLQSFREGQRAKVEPLIGQLREVRKQLREAGQDGKFDEAKVRALAEQQAKLTTELTVEHERMKAQFFSVLTPEQKTKMENARQLFHEMRGERRPGKPAPNVEKLN